MSAVAHFFVVVGGSKIHERLAHFFIDIYNHKFWNTEGITGIKGLDVFEPVV